MTRPIEINAEIQLTCTFGDVTSSRAFNEVYQNLQPAPRMVSVHVGVANQNQQGAGWAWITPDAVQEPVNWHRVGGDYCCWFASAPNLFHTMTFMVPPGWYYQVTKAADLIINNWSEWDFYGLQNETEG